jgi:DHA1 family bicyclomycin/chloramphenicol resistance-like MFS transporter
VLLWGMVAYVAASVGSALAASMDLLIVWRTVQGRMGAGVMGARAVVRDSRWMRHGPCPRACWA